MRNNAGCEWCCWGGLNFAHRAVQKALKSIMCLKIRAVFGVDRYRKPLQMRLMNHLRKTSDGYWEVRIAVPADCQTAIGKANLTKRLGRATKSDANKLAAPVIAEFQEAIRRARTPDAPPSLPSSFNHWLAGEVQIHLPPSFAHLQSDPSTPTATTQSLQTHSAAPAAPRNGVKLADLLKGYARERTPTEDTRERWERALNSLAAHVGHNDASRITPKDVVSWKEALMDTGTISAGTVKGTYLAGAKAVFGWASENLKIDTNPAANVTVRVPKKTTLRERAFTADEVLTILRASLLPPSKKVWAHTARARRWLPWLCAYAGTRVGEVAQLRGEDVRLKNGHWFMHITPEAGPIKDKKARWVPLHEHLVEQGFLDMVKEVGEGPLFHQPRCNPANIASEVAQWVRKAGVTDQGVSPNHGWRHLWKTLARNAGMEADARDAIQGHAARTEGDKYGGWGDPALIRAIGLIPRFEV
jgi:integrase